MRFLIGLIVVMGIAILVSLGFVAYGILRGTGGGPGPFGDRDLGLPPGCEIAESDVDGGRLVIRTDGLAERGCQQVLVIDLASGRVLGRFTIAPAAP